jgi:hypothetical protein
MMMQAGPDAINEGVKQLGNTNEQQQAQEWHAKEIWK